MYTSSPPLSAQKEAVKPRHEVPEKEKMPKDACSHADNREGRSQSTPTSGRRNRHKKARERGKEMVR